MNSSPLLQYLLLLLLSQWFFLSTNNDFSEKNGIIGWTWIECSLQVIERWTPYCYGLTSVKTAVQGVRDSPWPSLIVPCSPWHCQPRMALPLSVVCHWAKEMDSSNGFPVYRHFQLSVYSFHVLSPLHLLLLLLLPNLCLFPHQIHLPPDLPASPQPSDLYWRTTVGACSAVWRGSSRLSLSCQKTQNFTCWFRIIR